MLEKGSKAPDFEGIDQDGNTIKSKDLINKKWVLFFYPKADTPTCTVEACNIRDNYQDLINAGYTVLGISADDARKQQKFKEKHELPYPLIADADKVIAKAYGVWGPKTFMGREYEGIFRTTFVVDENGIIEKLISDVKAKTHTRQILAKLR
jgi:thioredoxin-dependent peroxiredoxin